MTFAIILGLLALSHFSKAQLDEDASAGDFAWVYTLFANVFSYALLIVPAAFLVRHVKANPDLMSGMFACGGGEATQKGGGGREVGAGKEEGEEDGEEDLSNHGYP